MSKKNLIWIFSFIITVLVVITLFIQDNRYAKNVSSNSSRVDSTYMEEDIKNMDTVIISRDLGAPGDVNDNDTTTPEMPRNHIVVVAKPGDMTVSLQKVFSEAAAGDTIFIKAGNYNLSNVLRIDRKKNVVIILDKNAVLRTFKHGYGIIDITASSEIKISGGKLSGSGVFLPKNYQNGKGGGEKHYVMSTGTGWGYHRNDMLKKLGQFHNGYIGNCGIGLLIHNKCSNITISDMEVYGFNYAGIASGFLGDEDEIQMNYSKNIQIKRCSLHNMYGSGISLHSVNKATVSNNRIENIGAPDQSPNDEVIDPGYGITLRGVKNGGAHAKNVRIIDNYVINCVRKGIDAHSGESCSIIRNEIRNSMITGIALVGTSGTRSRFEISGNRIYNCGTASTGGKADAKVGIASTYSNTRIIDNSVNNSGVSYGIYALGNDVYISKNIITGMPSTTTKSSSRNALRSTNNSPRNAEQEYNLGIYVLKGKSVKIEGNIISGQYQKGIYANDINGLTIGRNRYKMPATRMKDSLIMKNTLMSN